MLEKRETSRYARDTFAWNRFFFFFFHLTSRNFGFKTNASKSHGLLTYFGGLLITFVVNGTALVLGACSYENSSCWLSLVKRGRRRRYCVPSVSTRVERKIPLVNFIKLSSNESSEREFIPPFIRSPDTRALRTPANVMRYGEWDFVKEFTSGQSRIYKLWK